MTGPFDGVLGFSQGAAMASLLCALQQQSDADFRFRFAVMFGGFTPRSTDLVELYAPTAPLITIPTLHVYGMLT
jgi:predicted esterase